MSCYQCGTAKEELLLLGGIVNSHRYCYECKPRYEDERGGR